MKYRFLILTVVLIAFISSVFTENIDHKVRSKILSSFQNSPKKELFKVYHFLFKKEYDLNSEVGLIKYKTFKKTLALVEETNAKNLSYKLAINKFADLTNEEFREKYLGLKKESNTELSFLSEKSYFDLYADEEEEPKLDMPVDGIDYSENFGEVKDQGYCGSCWAFATVGALEGNYSKKFGKNLRFAEQQLVDCSNYTNGCNGSGSNAALKYVLESGIAYENAYEYISGISKIPGNCRYNEVSPNFILTGTKTCNSRTCTRALIRQYLSEGPLVSAIDGEGNGIFKNYSSGILDMPCTDDNHAIIMTGLGYDENRREFYRGRNSWGSDWGENGYFRLYVRDSDKSCYMESMAILPILKETNIPVPPPPAPQCIKLYSECGLKGEITETCSNISDIKSVPAGITLGKYKEVRLFLQPKCSGTSYKMDKGAGCFTDIKLTEPIRSLYIMYDEQPPKGCIWIYSDYCLTGEKAEVCSSITDLSVINFSNKISSIKFGPEITNIRAYTDKNHRGSSSYYYGERLSLSTTMDKNIESIKFNC